MFSAWSCDVFAGSVIVGKVGSLDGEYLGSGSCDDMSILFKFPWIFLHGASAPDFAIYLLEEHTLLDRDLG